MANPLPSMGAAAREAPLSVYTPTPITRGFSRLLVDLAAFIEAERDIEDVDIWDPAFMGWVRDAEHARQQVRGRLRALRGTVLHRREDGPLLRMARLIEAMIATEELGAFLARYHHLQRDRSAFRCPGNGAVAQRVNQLLAAGLSRIDDLVTLGCFADEAAEPAPETDLPDLIAG